MYDFFYLGVVKMYIIMHFHEIFHIASS